MLRLSKVSLAVIVSLFVFLAAGSVWHGVSPASAGSAPGPQRTVQLLTDRYDCDAIRGTDYESDDERTWFLAYCVGGPATSTQSGPIFYYLQQEVLLIPPVAARPPAPTARVTCNSSLATATVSEDAQQAPLAAFAGEPISCFAVVNGSYTSIDWAGGQVNGNGTTFVTSFGFRNSPWTVRVQVNWGGNPVIKYINVSTVAAGCPFGSSICIGR
jgi:hypothetical protein